MHKNHIIHRDLKPANILVEGPLKVKIIDLGMALRAGEKDCLGNYKVGTSGYRAPELIYYYKGKDIRCREGDNPEVSFALDIFPQACIIAEMLESDKYLFGKETISDHKLLLEWMATGEYEKDIVIYRLATEGGEDVLDMYYGMLYAKYPDKYPEETSIICSSRGRWEVTTILNFLERKVKELNKRTVKRAVTK